MAARRLSKAKMFSILSILTLFFATLNNYTSYAIGQPGLTMYVRADNTNTPNTPITEFYSGVCWQGGIANIDFQWGENGQGSCPVDYFTDFNVGYLKAPATGTIYFFNVSDDGFYMTINDSIVINDWEEQSAQNPNGYGSFKMKAGTVYTIKIWHHETVGDAWNQLFWSTTNDFATSVLVPNLNLATDSSYWGPTTSYCLFAGNSALAKNSMGQMKSNSAASLKSNGAGLCQNASTR